MAQAADLFASPPDIQPIDVLAAKLPGLKPAAPRAPRKKSHQTPRVDDGPIVRASAVAAPDRAIVIGGSMAGLLAARVLTDRFAEVVIVDRDTFPADATFRKGVPQSRHLHVLLARGAHILEELLPGFRADLAAEGAVSIRWPADVGCWVPPDGRPGGPGVSRSSRPGASSSSTWCAGTWDPDPRSTCSRTLTSLAC